MIHDLPSLLQRYCSSRFRDKHGVIVKGISDPISGVESDVYFFRIEHGLASERLSEELVLRIYTRVDAYVKSWHEFTQMEKLREAAYPVPRVLVLERDRSPFRQPFVIMERIAGQEMWQLLRSASEERRGQVLTQFASLLVQLHSLQWQRFVSGESVQNPGDPHAFLDHWLGTFRSLLARFQVPGLESVFDWLAARRDTVPCLRPSPIHSDFHPGNVLVRPDGSAVVLDWTGMEISDARFDLGHALVLLNCAGRPEWRDAVLEAYEALREAPVEQLPYFEVAACFKWFCALTLSQRYGSDKVGLGPDALTRLKPAHSVLTKAHDLLVARTNLVVPEVQMMIS